jgi:hypothetical protein
MGSGKDKQMMSANVIGQSKVGMGGQSAMSAYPNQSAAGNNNNSRQALPDLYQKSSKVGGAGYQQQMVNQQ